MQLDYRKSMEPRRAKPESRTVMAPDVELPPAGAESAVIPVGTTAIAEVRFPAKDIEAVPRVPVGVRGAVVPVFFGKPGGGAPPFTKVVTSFAACVKAVCKPVPAGENIVSVAVKAAVTAATCFTWSVGASEVVTEVDERRRLCSGDRRRDEQVVPTSLRRPVSSSMTTAAIPRPAKETSASVRTRHTGSVVPQPAAVFEKNTLATPAKLLTWAEVVTISSSLPYVFFLSQVSMAVSGTDLS